MRKIRKGPDDHRRRAAAQVEIRQGGDRKTGLFFDVLETKRKCEMVDGMIGRMHKETMVETKRLREMSRIDDALETSTRWKTNLAYLAGKRQNLYRKTCDLHDRYVDLRCRHDMFINKDEF